MRLSAPGITKSDAEGGLNLFRLILRSAAWGHVYEKAAIERVIDPGTKGR